MGIMKEVKLEDRNRMQSWYDTLKRFVERNPKAVSMTAGVAAGAAIVTSAYMGLSAYASADDGRAVGTVVMPEIACGNGQVSGVRLEQIYPFVQPEAAATDDKDGTAGSAQATMAPPRNISLPAIPTRQPRPSNLPLPSVPVASQASVNQSMQSQVTQQAVAKAEPEHTYQSKIAFIGGEGVRRNEETANKGK